DEIQEHLVCQHCDLVLATDKLAGFICVIAGAADDSHPQFFPVNADKKIVFLVYECTVRKEEHRLAAIKNRFGCGQLSNECFSGTCWRDDQQRLTVKDSVIVDSR